MKTQRLVHNKTLKINYPSILIKVLEKYEDFNDRREVVADSMFKYIASVAVGTSIRLREQPKRLDSVESIFGATTIRMVTNYTSKIRNNKRTKNEALAFKACNILFHDATHHMINANCTLFTQVAYCVVR